MNLVVGATGVLGREVVKLLREANKPVAAMVRPGASEDIWAQLESQGAQLRIGDLKDPASVAEACKGVTTVISTATATLSRKEGDAISTVDEEGQLCLVDAAERACISRFVYVSFAPLSVDCALQRAKRAVERRLQESRLSFTILQPVDFMEVWLSPVLGFDPVNGRARIWGAGDKPVSWISLFDVARFAVAASENVSLTRRTLPLGGPDALSPLRVVEIFRELGAPPVHLEFIPEEALVAQLQAASDPIQEAFAALMLSTARGYTANPRDAVQFLPGRLSTVRDYAANCIKRSQTTLEVRNG